MDAGYGVSNPVSNKLKVNIKMSKTQIPEYIDPQYGSSSDNFQMSVDKVY